MFRRRDEIVERFLRYERGVLESIERVYGDKLDLVLESLLKPTSRLYLRVNTLKTSVEEVLDLIREESFQAYRDELIEEAIYFKVEGPNSIKDHGLRVIVDKRASESILMGANVYSPGVVYCDPEIKPGSLVTIYSENMIPIAEGEAVTDCKSIKRIGRGLFLKSVKSLYKAPPIRDLRVWIEGFVYPQSLPAMLTSRLLDPRAGDSIIDMCAAPGGKTSHIYELSRGDATIYAFDHSKRRIEEMISNLRRLGHLNSNKIIVINSDSRYISRDYKYLVADKILLDPPCTSTGVRPKIYDLKTERELRDLVEYQRQFLSEAYKVLRRGGILVYSTCSITYDENEGLINRFLRERLFEQLDPPEWVFRIARAGVDEIGIRFDPYNDAMPGYFIAILRKI
ncbi:MAG: PUA domain-containing protein [Sulfolobales archaeon]